MVEFDKKDAALYNAFQNLFPTDFGDVNVDEMAKKAQAKKEEDQAKEVIVARIEKMKAAEAAKEEEMRKYAPIEEETLNENTEEQLLENPVANIPHIDEIMTNDNVAPEKVDEAYNALLNTQLTDEQIQQINEHMEENPDAKAMKEIAEKIESGELSAEGELINASISVNPETGERQVVEVNPEFKPDNTNLEELVENPDIDHADIELSDEVIQKTAEDQFNELKPEEMFDLVALVKEYKEGKVTNNQAFERLPIFLKNQFNDEARKAGIPLNNLKTYKKAFVKSVMQDLIDTAEMQQASIDFDKQIAQIYQDYGNDVSLLYQSGIFEKIQTLRNTVEDMSKENEDGSKDEKIQSINDIIDSLFESIYFEKFASFVKTAKIKPIEWEKPQKVFRDFIVKYENSKFMISDINNIIPALQRYCGFEEKDAYEFGLLFCKYTRNMKASNLAEHSFMYYVIANIISLNTYGITDIDNSDNKFLAILVHNLTNLMKSRKDKSFEYIPEKIDEDYMSTIIVKASEKAKELEEEAERVEDEDVCTTECDSEDSTEESGEVTSESTVSEQDGSILSSNDSSDPIATETSSDVD